MRISRLILAASVIGGLCVASSVVAVLFWKMPLQHTEALLSQSALLVVGSRNISLEIAKTYAEQQKGLGGRPSLAKDSGMLFIFSSADIQPFWMKDMQFPIDILWISGDTIVERVTLPAPTSTITAEIPRYEPKSVADKVLELNAGQADELGLFIGKRVQIRQ